MQERLHIDEMKRIEKQVNTLVKSWQKLTRSHTQLEEKYAILNEEMARVKSRHQEKLAELEQRHCEAEEAARLALESAVSDEGRRWQQKYDETIAAHETQLRETNDAHQNELNELRLEMERKEQALTRELEQVRKVKNALSNRVLGVAE